MISFLFLVLKNLKKLDKRQKINFDLYIILAYFLPNNFENATIA